MSLMMGQEFLVVIRFNRSKRLKGPAGVKWVLRMLVKGGFHKNFVAILATNKLVHLNLLTILVYVCRGPQVILDEEGLFHLLQNV